MRASSRSEVENFSPENVGIISPETTLCRGIVSSVGCCCTRSFRRGGLRRASCGRISDKAVGNEATLGRHLLFACSSGATRLRCAGSSCRSSRVARFRRFWCRLRHLSRTRPARALTNARYERVRYCPDARFRDEDPDHRPARQQPFGLARFLPNSQVRVPLRHHRRHPFEP